MRRGKDQRAQPRIEQLERRDLLASSLTATLSGGLLRIEGTPAADSIRILQTNDRVAIDGIVISTPTGPSADLPVGGIRRIEIQPLEGADNLFIGRGTWLDSVPLTLGQGSNGDQLTLGATSNALPSGSLLMVLQNGSLFVLAPNGEISRGLATVVGYGGFQLLSGGVAEFTIEGGNLFLLTRTGTVVSGPAATVTTAQFKTIAEDVTKFAVFDGQVFVLHRNGRLEQSRTDGTWELADNDPVRSFAVDSGLLFAHELNNNILYQRHTSTV
jgi:hypothetical protein